MKMSLLKSEIAFDLEKALEYVPVEDRADLSRDYQTRLQMIAQMTKINRVSPSRRFELADRWPVGR